MPCIAAVCQLHGHRRSRCPRREGALSNLLAASAAALAVLCMLLLGAAPARAQGVEVLELKAYRDETFISVDYQLRVTLPMAVEDAALRGVPIYFTAQATLWRPRWYWRDERVAQATREWRLSFQPLTKNWRVSQGGLGQSFATLAEALVGMTRSTAWHIGDAREVDPPDGRHYLEFGWRLDTAQLPRPLQIGLGGIGGASEWSLDVERSVKLGAEPAK
jgi:hypothetical protein